MKNKICLQWLWVSRVRSEVGSVPLVPVWGDVGRGFARKMKFWGITLRSRFCYFGLCAKQSIYFFQSALNIFYKKKKKKKKIQRSGRDKIYNPTRASNPKI